MEKKDCGLDQEFNEIYQELNPTSIARMLTWIVLRLVASIIHLE
jgi:hypothetical protein